MKNHHSKAVEIKVRRSNYGYGSMENELPLYIACAIAGSALLVCSYLMYQVHSIF